MSAIAQAVRERPILFSAEMVRALLRDDSPKTQTRRVMKSQPYGNGYRLQGNDLLCHNDHLPPSAILLDVGRGRDRYTTSNMEGWENECPYGQPGDRLWVREAFAYDRVTLDTIWYRAHHDSSVFEHFRFGWRPSIHMPRVCSRITLEITDVRVERVQDVSPDDAAAEGYGDYCPHNDGAAAIVWFSDLWERINGPRGYGWDANPWVWAITFKRVEA